MALIKRKRVKELYEQFQDKLDETLPPVDVEISPPKTTSEPVVDLKEIYNENQTRGVLPADYPVDAVGVVLMFSNDRGVGTERI